MRYKWIRSRGLFAGADAVTTLRCREASSQWETSAVHRTTRHVPPEQAIPEDDLQPLQN
jgi:hypothetical protein